MSKAIYKYMKNGEPVYLTFNDAGECVDWRSGHDALGADEIIADLVHKLVATELAALVIKSQCKQISEAMAIINDQRTRIEHGL